MNIEIRTNLHLTIYGFGRVAANKDYVGTAFKLSSQLWEVVKSNGIKNKGMNIWVYESADKLFAGVEVEKVSLDKNYGLEKKKINLKKYAYYKHIGPYHLIKQAGQNMSKELREKGFEIILPYIEIYGHWSADESKLETELLMCVQ